ncbi:MAG: hypothetical protein ACKOGH_03030 [Alphaproteobacteria bacterium]
MSTAMPRATLHVASLLLAALLGACAPTHEWAAPGIGPATRDMDMDDCRAFGARAAAGSGWFHGMLAERDARWARRPSDRAMASMQLHQARMFEARERQRHFDACMNARGYRQVPIDAER